MKSCENCGVPQEKRPGVCLEFMAKYTDGPYNCWKPIVCKTCGGAREVQKENCNDCHLDEEINRNSSTCKKCKATKIPCPTCQRPKKPEKTCGNCGWHDKHYKGNTWAVCNNSKHPYESIHDGHGFRTEDTRKAGELRSCQWKPICETCGGTGKIRDQDYAHRYYYDPCPDCHKPKEERLMMPVRWDNYHESNVLIAEIQEEEYFSTWVAKCVSEHSKWKVYVNSRDFGETKLPIEFHEREEAIQAVEKALKIERG